MAKKRNAGKLRRQEYPDADELTDARDRAPSWQPEEAYPQEFMAPKIKVDYALKSEYTEGDVVTLSLSQLIGTVVQCAGRDLMVLDVNGIMHRCKDADVYRHQNSS